MRDPILTERAKAMHKTMSEPETRMWLALRAERFDNVKFRRQKVSGNCIADFAANDPKLVVEIDGDTHAGREEYDAQRTQHLESKGYTVIRFTNSDVMANMDGVSSRLRELISELRASSPLPTLSPEGERAK
jgi:very-short-patch-repair endonuclease